MYGDLKTTSTHHWHWDERGDMLWKWRLFSRFLSLWFVRHIDLGSKIPAAYVEQNVLLERLHFGYLPPFYPEPKHFESRCFINLYQIHKLSCLRVCLMTSLISTVWRKKTSIPKYKYIYIMYYIDPIRWYYTPPRLPVVTAQGGGGSFKNRKTYRRHWLMWVTDVRAKTLTNWLTS